MDAEEFLRWGEHLLSLVGADQRPNAARLYGGRIGESDHLHVMQWQSPGLLIHKNTEVHTHIVISF